MLALKSVYLPKHSKLIKNTKLYRVENEITRLICRIKLTGMSITYKEKKSSVR